MGSRAKFWLARSVVAALAIALVVVGILEIQGSVSAPELSAVLLLMLVVSLVVNARKGWIAGRKTK